MRPTPFKDVLFHSRVQARGFTLYELLVVLILSSIVILFANKIYLYTSQYVQQYQRRQNALIQINRLVFTMNRDFDNSIVTNQDQKIIFSNSTTFGCYWMEGNIITREVGGVRDTLLTSLLGYDVDRLQTTNTRDSTQFMRKLTLFIENEKSGQKIEIVKNYTSDFLVNLLE